MDNTSRGAYLELDRLMNQHIFIYYGAMKAKIIAIDARRGRVLITLEEENGAHHDIDKDERDVPAFLSRLKFSIQKETARLDFVIGHHKQCQVPVEYDIASVNTVKGVPRYILFSTEFTASEFLRRNLYFRYARSQEKLNAIYLVPCKKHDDSSWKVTKRSGKRSGIYCGHVACWFTEKRYIVDVVELSGQNVLKLVKKM
jgi:hypothetical protein